MTSRPSPSGVLVVDKPSGPTSHDVVARVRRALKTRHVGHAGTLDPMATGVLVVAVGEGTKLVPWLTADDKTYEATVRLGIETDTLDADGKETGRAPIDHAIVRHLSGEGELPALLATALAEERARLTQIPPAYSAIKIGGERAHDLARAGRLADALPARPVAVRALELIGGHVDADVVELVVRVEAAKGYFVRSLGRDLARALGTVGHLTALRRTRSGVFSTTDAVAVEAVAEEALLSVSTAAARALPVTGLDPAGVQAASFGQRVAPAQMTTPHRRPSAWLDAAARLIAVGECDEEGYGRVLRGFGHDPPIRAG